MTPIHSHVAHPSALFIDSGSHSRLIHSLSAPSSLLFSQGLPPYYLHFLELYYSQTLAQVIHTYSLYAWFLLFFLIFHCLYPHCLHLLAYCLSLSHSFKVPPNVTPVSTHHSCSAPDSCWVDPTSSHSTLIESYSVSDIPLFTHIGPHFPHFTHLGPHFPHFTHLGPSDLHPLSFCCIIASSSPSSAL